MTAPGRAGLGARGDGREEALRVAMRALRELVGGETARRLAALRGHVAAIQRNLPEAARQEIITACGALLDPPSPAPAAAPADRLAALLNGETGREIDVLWEHVAAVERLLPRRAREALTAEFGQLLDRDPLSPPPGAPTESPMRKRSS
jgi:hypothetical protein